MATQQELLEAVSNLRNQGLLNNQPPQPSNLGLFQPPVQLNTGLLNNSSRNANLGLLNNSSRNANLGLLNNSSRNGESLEEDLGKVAAKDQGPSVGTKIKDVFLRLLDKNLLKDRALSKYIDAQNYSSAEKDYINSLTRDQKIQYLTRKGKDRKIIVQDGIQYYVDTGERVLKNVKKSENPYETRKLILSERKEIGKFYKPINQAVVGFKKLEDALKQKDGTAAYTSLVLFMKNLDGSVVKSDEVRAFGQAQGLLGNIQKQIEETKGKGMTDEMRVGILNLAKSSTRHMLDGYENYLAGTEAAYEGINLPSESIFSGYLINREGLDLTPATVDFFQPRIELK
jgi:hypothetical protein